MSLKEIARIAGTSVSTVSRVLNQPDYKCKNPELESRIWAAAQEIRYTPNTAAQTLKSGISLARTEEKTMTFDIFLTRFPSLSQDLFFSELFEFLKKELLRQQCVIGKFLTLPEVTSMLNEKSSFSATDNMRMESFFSENVLPNLFLLCKIIIIISLELTVTQRLLPTMK